MRVEEFRSIMPKLRSWTDYLYFHLMGEPLCHPSLSEFLSIAGEHQFRVILTTNGTLLKKQTPCLAEASALHKVNISLHSFEANEAGMPFSKYLEECFAFGKAMEGKKIVVYRLWNHGGADQRNQEILEKMTDYFPKPWKEGRRGISIGDHIFLEYGDKFDWPDLQAPEGSDRISCYGLRDQLGILCDGTVVPCCLDHEGDLSLGNIHRQSMEEILLGERAQAIYQGFLNGHATETLCKKCGYARRFQK